MRLLRFHIEQLLLLRDLDLRFDKSGRLNTEEYTLDFLVGINGSGKSTLLRALTQVIADLRADLTTAFHYTLEYELQGRDGPYLVSISQTKSDAGARRHMRVRSRNSLDASPVYEADAIDQSFLPNRLVIYTTGSEAEWERLLYHPDDTSDAPAAPDSVWHDPVRRAVHELPGHLPRFGDSTDSSEGAKQPFLLIRASRLPVVTLGGLLSHLATRADEERPLERVLGSINIQHVRGFSLRFRLHKSLSPFETYERLVPLATCHIKQGTDHLLVFDLSSDDTIPNKILEEFGGSLTLFEKLDHLMNPSKSGEPTLQQVNLFLERDAPSAEAALPTVGETVSRVFLLDWLSDGEQSFLGRMALLAMLNEKDSLILLDEPDVHFNDYWKREVVSLLHRIMHKHSNHLLVITHSSIALSDVPESQIAVLVRDDNGWAQVQEPSLKTFGADPSEIMIAIFQAELSTGAYATALLETAMTSREREVVEKLLHQVGPGMWRFRLRQRLEELSATPT